MARGRAHLALNEPGAARADLDEAIRLEPEAGAAYYHRARLHELEGRLDQARADLDRALEYARSSAERERALELRSELGGGPGRPPFDGGPA